MKTVKFKNGNIFNVEYLTNTGIRTKAVFDGKIYKNGIGCDIYDVLDNNNHIAIVLNSVNGDIRKSVTIITMDEYEKICELYDQYEKGRFHTACLERCGAENLLKLL